ncbi:hypothetical protein BDV34DRAFT_218910 [Aspergillus parasiticus]|uniref:SSCRP protein n=1 Tax=Aspergillus parasiticus TaxID=5067 RepID=A0A5N6E7V7_ASPPA|nr:hypothetical protein BDV34DRAFT_218910 [Aspergillus parasiticus]
MKFTSVAAILAFACAAVAAPQGHEGHEGGDDHNSHGHEGNEIQNFCCTANTVPPGAGYIPTVPLYAPQGCAYENGGCSDDFNIPWTCGKVDSHEAGVVCQCTSPTKCPGGASPDILGQLLAITG